MGTTVDDWEKALENISFLKKQQLREILQANDEDTEGTYQELFERVREFLRANPERRRTIFSEYPDSFNSSKTTVKNTSGSGIQDPQHIQTQNLGVQNVDQNYPAYSTPDNRRTLAVPQQLMNINLSDNSPDFQFHNIPNNFHKPA